MLNAREAAYVLRHSGAKGFVRGFRVDLRSDRRRPLNTEVEQLIWLPSEQGHGSSERF